MILNVNPARSAVEYLHDGDGEGPELHVCFVELVSGGVKPRPGFQLAAGLQQSSCLRITRRSHVVRAGSYMLQKGGKSSCFWFL